MTHGQARPGPQEEGRFDRPLADSSRRPRWLVKLAEPGCIREGRSPSQTSPAQRHVVRARPCYRKAIPQLGSNPRAEGLGEVRAAGDSLSQASRMAVARATIRIVGFRPTGLPGRRPSTQRSRRAVRKVGRHLRTATAAPSSYTTYESVAQWAQQCSALGPVATEEELRTSTPTVPLPCRSSASADAASATSLSDGSARR